MHVRGNEGPAAEPLSTGGMPLARVRVYRYDPSMGGQPYYDEFHGVPFQDRSVLEVLHHIYREMDSSLGYRHVCTKGFCGSCMLVVNGLPVLACQYPAQQEMTIEPHHKFPVVRDLVVDLNLGPGTGHHETGPSAGTQQAAAPSREERPGGPRTRIDPQKCVNCRDCVAVCPVGVYGLVNKRVTVVDEGSCLGPSCNMCVDTCWKMAINMVSLPPGS